MIRRCCILSGRWIGLIFLGLAMLGVGGLGLAPAVAQDDQQDPESSTTSSSNDENLQTKSPTKQISAIKSSLRKQISELSKQYQKATNEAERAALATQRRRDELAAVTQVIELTNSRDNDKRNIRDLVWFVTRTKGKARTQCHQQIISNYLESEHLTEFVRGLGKSSQPSPETESWLRSLIESSPHLAVKGTATLTLAEFLIKIEKELDKGAAAHPLAITILGTRSADELSSEIKSLLDQFVGPYSDVTHGRQLIGDLAKRTLTQMMLSLGNVAPDIVGVDLDDVEFKLSDYRGKVVMIDFWGDW